MQTNTKSQLTVAQRVQSPTPPFFKKLRVIGLSLAAVGTAIIAGPVALPVIVAKIAGYVAVAGGVISAVSQATVEDNTKYQEEQDE
jgi:hypothetical protein